MLTLGMHGYFVLHRVVSPLYNLPIDKIYQELHNVTQVNYKPTWPKWQKSYTSSQVQDFVALLYKILQDTVGSLARTWLYKAAYIMKQAMLCYLQCSNYLLILPKMQGQKLEKKSTRSFQIGPIPPWASVIRQSFDY